MMYKSVSPPLWIPAYKKDAQTTPRGFEIPVGLAQNCSHLFPAVAEFDLGSPVAKRPCAHHGPDQKGNEDYQDGHRNVANPFHKRACHDDKATARFSEPQILRGRAGEISRPVSAERFIQGLLRWRQCGPRPGRCWSGRRKLNAKR